jgi:hypothetical protein
MRLMAQALIWNGKSVDIEDFLSRDFAGRVAYIRDRLSTAMRSAELAQVWSHLLGHLVTTNAPPSMLVPLARQTIVLSPTAPDVDHICELLFPLATPAHNTVVHLVISCVPRIHKALELRDQLLDRKNPVVVVVGREGACPDVFEDGVMALDVPDTYEALPKKVLEALFAVRRYFGALPVLKIDDDCTVRGTPNQAGTAALLNEHQFAGELVGDEWFDRCWHFGKCSSPVFNTPYEKPFVGAWPDGPLYYLGPRAVEVLVRTYVRYPGIIEGEMFEDKLVADLLRSHGISPAHVDLAPIFGLAGNYEPFSPA